MSPRENQYSGSRMRASAPIMLLLLLGCMEPPNQIRRAASDAPAAWQAEPVPEVHPPLDEFPTTTDCDLQPIDSAAGKPQGTRAVQDEMFDLFEVVIGQYGRRQPQDLGHLPEDNPNEP